MELKRVGLRYKDEKILLDLKVCNFFCRGIGLMFTRREKAKALLFDFKNPVLQAIHSLFVFFDFIAIWIDEEGKIVEVKMVTPWTFSILPSRKFKRLVEIPINEKYLAVSSLFINSTTRKQKI